jgi:uncharacterized protein YjbJ (UPF0337 family)
MNKDRIAGAAKEAKGVVTETAGKIFGDAKMTARGHKGEKPQARFRTPSVALKDALTKSATLRSLET